MAFEKMNIIERLILSKETLTETGKPEKKKYSSIFE